MKILSLTCLISLSYVGLYAQSSAYIDFTPYPYDLNNPGIELHYSAGIYNASTCGQITWTITNGKIQKNSNEWVTSLNLPYGTDAIIKWDDVTAKGKLNATVTCTEGALSVEKEFPICSLNGLNLTGGYMGVDWRNVPLCQTVSSFQVSVSQLMMTWTGGVNGSPMLQADGYEWTIPAGWTANGHTGPATFNDIEGIVVTPSSACSGGTISVRAYKTCFQPSYSNSTSFNMDKIKPSPTIQVSASTDSYCGNTQAVTFTAPTYSCVSNYTWNVTAPGWLPSGTPSVFTTAQNTITLVPSGGGLDAGSISVTANLSCGTTIPAQGLALTYKNPVISVSDNIMCTTNKEVDLLNVASTGVTVNWSVDPIVQIVSGQGTPVVFMKQAGTLGGNATINATVSCPSTSVAPKPIWVGKPSMDLSIDGTAGPYPLCGTGTIGYTAMQDHTISASLGGTTSVNYSLNGPAGVVSGSALSATAYDYISQSSTANFSITAATSNGCGSVSQCLSFSNGTCSAPTISSTTINGSTWYGDCQSNYFTFSTGTWYTITVNPNPAGTPVSFYVNDYYVISQTLSSTQFRVKCSNASESFAVIASVSNGCGTNSQCIWFSNSGVGAPKSVIRPPEGAIVIRAYPNPVSSILHVQLVDSLSSSLKLNQVYQLNLVNKFSQTVYSIQSSDKNIQIPVDRFPADIYYLNVFYGDAVLREQIVIGK